MDYHRAQLKGGTYFFTLVTHNRLLLLGIPDHLNLLKLAIDHVKAKRPFAMAAYVILPDHLHCVWRLPENDNDFSTRWRLIKHYVSCHAPQHPAVWQKRFWEHVIRDENDYRRHLDYIHYNPVKHRLVNHPREWPHSSYHRYREGGGYDPGWGETAPVIAGEFGE